jgi:hypothetical protein
MILFKSFYNITIVAAKNDVLALTKVITIKAFGGYIQIKENTSKIMS